ncbi:hypothetical protein VZ52_09445 [Ralstonia mannitolilytica]|nr:hypothetical protein VZ52_09445 [Ralstonia mannitolilytica]
MRRGVALAGASLALTTAIANAQAPGELPLPLLGQLMGFVQNAYFNANRVADTPKFPTDRAATQPEVLKAVASALQVRQRSCASVISVDYADDSGNMLAINCAGGNYLVDAKRGKISP